MSNRDRAVEVLAAHNIECTGPGEVTCRGCRDEGWMSWPSYRQHVADALIAAGLIHVGQGFCTKVANCRLADGHAAGCERT